MNVPVKVLELARDARPDARAVLAAEFVVSAETLEDARRATLERLATDGRQVRSLSFTTDGELAAVVYPPAPPPQPAPAAPTKRRRGGR